MPAGINIGEGDYRRLRESESEAVDKTRLIQDILDDKSRVLLFPRPRRFGKTLNMTMLYEFLARQDKPAEHLFNGTHLYENWSRYQKHFQRYPTLFLTFKSLTVARLDEWESTLRMLLSDMVRFHWDILPTLDANEKEQMQLLLDQKADAPLMRRSLLLLSRWLERAYGEKVVVLIDEYDSPIQDAWLVTEAALQRPPELSPQVLLPNGDSLYTVVVGFFRLFLGSALKDSPHVAKAVLTGILRVSKESIFSELNNLDVKTIVDTGYSDAFGFTEAEVISLFERQNQTHRLELARKWYNGYRFGLRTIYNPWSVMNFLKEPTKYPEAYWINTSSNDLIKHSLKFNALHYFEDFQTLLEGGSLVKPLQLNLSLPQIQRSRSALYSLLLFAGYLKAELVDKLESGEGLYSLSIPNLEVSRVYRESFLEWLELHLRGQGTAVEELTEAILGGDEGTVQRMLQEFALDLLSITDRPAHHPEALYQGLLLGLCGGLQAEYQVLSNRESGFGRADLMLIPRRPGRAGAVLELKVAQKGKKTLATALKEGEAQLQERKYIRSLEAAQSHPIHCWVVAFDGKKVKVKWIDPE